MMKRILVLLIAFFPFFLVGQDKVGINTDTPATILDVRGTDDETSGGNMQLATPSLNHFLHFFGGRGGDPRPFMSFSQDDTFRIVTHNPDFSNFTERLTILGSGEIGINAPTGDYTLLEEPFQVFADQYYYLNVTDQASMTGSQVQQISALEHAGQIFTVGKTGFLTGFEMIARTLGPGQSKLSYFIYENDENGVQLDAGTVIMVNTTFDTIQFNTSAIAVTAGQQLFLELRYDSDADAEWRYSLDDPYEPGDAQFYDGSWNLPGGSDLTFRSYVDEQYADRLPVFRVLDGEGRVQINNYKMPTTYGAFNQVLMSNGAGEVIWGNTSGVFENVGGVVRNTGSHPTDDFVFGSPLLSTLSSNMFFFDKDKGAFRTGRVTTNSWQETDLGQFSVASGFNTRASGYGSTASGRETNAIGNYSNASGRNTSALGQYAFAHGYLSTAAGENATSFGQENTSSGLYSFSGGFLNVAKGQSSVALNEQNDASAFAATALGYQTQAFSSAVTVVGMWNDPITPAFSSITSTSPLFVVGNGDGDGNDNGNQEGGRSNALVVQKDGRVGIGTSYPYGVLHLKNTSWNDLIIESELSDPVLRLTDNAPATNEDWTIRMDVSEGDMLDIRSSGASRFRMKPNGDLAIGTSNFATGYKVSIGGGLIAEALRCQLEGAWPDYVFSDNYELMSLEQLEESIQQNHHLPGIPSAEEVEAEGIDVGEMQKLMMEKIEELTIHVIELNKKNKELEAQISRLATEQMDLNKSK